MLFIHNDFFLFLSFFLTRAQAEQRHSKYKTLQNHSWCLEILKSCHWNMSAYILIQREHVERNAINRTQTPSWDIYLDSFGLLMYVFISTEAWLNGDIFICVQWGFDINLTFKTHHNGCTMNSTIWLGFNNTVVYG